MEDSTKVVSVSDVFRWLDQAEPFHVGQVLSHAATIVSLELHQQKVKSRKSGKVGDWLSTASTALELGITGARLKRLAKTGQLEEGYHYLKPNIYHPRIRYFWNVDRCKEFFEPSPIVR